MRKGTRTLILWLVFLAVLLTSATLMSAGGTMFWVGVAGFGVLAALLAGLTIYSYLRNRKRRPDATRA